MPIFGMTYTYILVDTLTSLLWLARVNRNTMSLFAFSTAVFKHIDDMTFIQAPSSPEQHISDHHQKRNAVVSVNALWSGGVIPYRISARFHSM